MTRERTLAMIKPDAVAAHNVGKIIDMIEDAGFSILRMQMMNLTKDQASQFYKEHAEKSHFGEILSFMTSGPLVVMVLEKDNAIKAWRDLMGSTNPAKADEGTIRKKFGTDIGANATHGSDSPEAAVIEIKQFFSDLR
jgi:nucleoside-diphosphate kinase